MSDEWKTSVENALKSLADAIKDAAQLDVITYTMNLDKPENDPEYKKKVAQTELKLDGDANRYIPVRTVNGELAIHQDLYKKHEEGTEKAIQARLEILNTAKGLLSELKALLD